MDAGIQLCSLVPVHKAVLVFLSFCQVPQGDDTWQHQHPLHDSFLSRGRTVSLPCCQHSQQSAQPGHCCHWQPWSQCCKRKLKSNFKKKVLNNLLFMAPRLISAWNAYEDLKIRLFRHTPTRTHTHAHTHTQPLHYEYMHYRWWVGR